jgi:NADH-quinone oxidoreductase subunit C
MPLSIQLANLLPSARVVASSNSVTGETRVAIPATHLLQTLTLLRRHTGREFSQLRAITAIDNPERNRRFEVVYLLLSPSTGQRLAVSVHVSEGTPLPSATSVYSSAGWYERETWDRFGILFTGHPDLRRRLTDYGFKGHPLRKDFPVTGYVEVRYDDVRKRILYEGVSLAQEFRLFTLDQPWS